MDGRPFRTNEILRRSAYLMVEADIAIIAILLRPAVQRLMRHLVISGDSWEIRRQRRLLYDRHKEYRLLFAHDSSHTFEFMDAVTSILIDDNACELLLSRAERRQLE